MKRPKQLPAVDRRIGKAACTPEGGGVTGSIALGSLLPFLGSLIG